MNRIFLKLIFSAIFIITSLIIQAQHISFPDNKGKDHISIISSKQDAMRFSVAVDQFDLSNVKVQGETMQQLNFGLSLVPGKAGAPDLPSIVKNILIPDGAQVQMLVLSSEKVIYENIEIAPAAEIPFDTQADIPAIKGSEYSINEAYPAHTTDVRTTEIRGMHIAQIGIFPFQYNPIEKTLVVYKNMEIELQISNSKGTFGEERFRSPFWDQILSDIVFNENDIPKVDYSLRNKSSKEVGCEYLIVVPNHPDFLAWADTIRRFRNEQGIDTKIVTIDDIGGNDVNTIDDYFEDVYANWDPVPSAVLLMADYGNDDMTITSKKRPHPYEDYYISDNDYADVTGNILPDFVFARITARDNEELEIMVNKFTHYERNPPTLESFYNEPITALGWQTERWFQICTETIGGYMTNVLGKTPQRINAIYEGNPQNDPWSTANNTYSVTSYFGPNGQGYIPSSPSELDDWTGGTATDVVNAINSGAFILQHRDHGYYGGWGEPGFHTNNINSLNNANLLTHVFSINCQTGQFDEGNNCFAEKFHRHAEGGALSVTAPTQVSYSFVNDAFVWGMYDNMWPDFMPDYGGNLIPERDFRPAFGAASGKYFLSSTGWAGGSMKPLTYQLFHNQGDAFGIVYTDMPQDNTVAYDQGMTSEITNIDVEAAPHSLVGLSVEGEFLASGITDENGLVNISFTQQNPNTIIKIVITKQNYFRYEGEILVVPATGPYVIATNHEINDIDANGNGIIEYNEDIYLDFSVKNIGVEIAENVIISLSSNDEYIQITDASENLGNLSAGQELTIEQAFSFNSPVNIPDEHEIVFMFSASNGDETWESEIILTAYAPNLEYTLLSFEEIEGNGNGYLDPGETATARFETSNTGHIDFPAGSSSLIANSSYITISTDVQNFDQIAIDETLITEFEITTSASTPPSSIASIINTLNASPFDINREMYFNIGLVVEDWEMENFNKFNWGFSGDSDWEIVDDYVEEGDFSAKASNLNDNESAGLILEYDLIADHEISFYIQVSSEEDHDFLNFYIDDELQASWSGLILFEQFAFPVSQGSHTFKWEYIKDEDSDSGLDAAWVDFIILPPGNTVISTDDIDKNESFVKTYPNPTHDYLNMATEMDEEIKYQIINSLGQSVFSSVMKKNDQVDVSKYQPGIYIIKFQGIHGQQQIHQFIKM
jgi:hypothetical protein